ncbi:hypothetical protein ABFS83_06G135400 [Erythranthe nasuta]
MMRRRKVRASKNPVKYICVIVTVSFIIVQIISALQLTSTISSSPKPVMKPSIGELGETVIGMLPEDLAFTLFLPSEEAFRRDLRLDRNDSDSYATLTRVLGFSAVPRWIRTADLDLDLDLEYGEERVYGSISGFDLVVSKGLKGMVVVNGVVVSEKKGLRKGSVVVYVMDGVLMDAEFRQSVQPDDDDVDDRPAPHLCSSLDAALLAAAGQRCSPRRRSPPVLYHVENMIHIPPHGICISTTISIAEEHDPYSGQNRRTGSVRSTSFWLGKIGTRPLKNMR